MFQTCLFSVPNVNTAATERDVHENEVLEARVIKCSKKDHIVRAEVLGEEKKVRVSNTYGCCKYSVIYITMNSSGEVTEANAEPVRNLTGIAVIGGMRIYPDGLLYAMAYDSRNKRLFMELWSVKKGFRIGASVKRQCICADNEAPIFSLQVI